MIVRSIKLKLNKNQERLLSIWMWRLTGVWNWAIKKIENDAKDKVYYSILDFQNLLAGHGKKIEIPSHTLQGILKRAYQSWSRCHKGLSKKPKLKGFRNKLNSIPFPDNFRNPSKTRIYIPGLGKVNFFKQKLPNAKIKCGCIIKRPSGWYLSLWLDTEHKFSVKNSTEAVAIDPGFSTLLTLSNGIKIQNPRELTKLSNRLAQAQKGKHKKLTSRLHEKQSNIRKDRNHKISRKLVETYSTIYYSKDNFKNISTSFGKSVTEAALGQLITYLIYKSRIGGRILVLINSKFTTMTCSNCGIRNGPKGLKQLNVRNWKCVSCGETHDRDVNAARVIFKTGLGWSLNDASNSIN